MAAFCRSCHSDLKDLSVRRESWIGGWWVYIVHGCSMLFEHICDVYVCNVCITYHPIIFHYHHYSSIYLPTYLPIHPSIHPETSPCFPGLPNVFPGPFTWARSASCLVKNGDDECLMAISWGYIMAQWMNNRNIYHIQWGTVFFWWDRV